jgi:ferredoxin
MRSPRVAAALLLLGCSFSALAERRFPPPDFESGYTQPVLTFQEHSAGKWEYVDVSALALALGLSAWLLHTQRSRKGLYLLGIGSLLYFGFFKEGCVCPIGSIQNVTLALVDRASPASFMVVATFILPLVAALLYGRVFCGGVCPLGIIQDMFLFRPLRVPVWLEGALGLFRFFYLGLAVFFVAVYSRFIICEYDPFVSLFRFSGPLWKFVLGGSFLLVGLFVARPYCRFFCPYGGLLSLLSRWTSTGVRITPDECNNCTLCHAVCPFGAIHPAREPRSVSPKLRMGLFLSAVLIPIVLAVGGYLLITPGVAGMLLGLWFGIVIAAKLVGLAYPVRRKIFTTDNAECLSCARCYQWCPYERMRAESEVHHAG